MRKQLLGTIAALLAGAGGALAQSASARPVAGPARSASPMVDTMVKPANQFNPPIPAPLPGGPEGYGMMPEGPMPGGDPNAGPIGWPPPGQYGAPPYDDPEFGGSLFNGSGPATRFFVDGQYLLLFPKSQPTNYPLLSSSAPADLGRVGNPTTTILAGDKGRLNIGTAHGFRLGAGWWRPEDSRAGVEVGAFYMSPVSSNTYFQGSESGVPLLARPFLNDASGTPVSLILSSPDIVSGSSLTRAMTQAWGIEANALWNAYRTCPGECRTWNLNFLAGYRYFDLTESLQLSSRSTILEGNTLSYAGTLVGEATSLEIRERFDAKNKWHGGQIGFQSQFTSGRWYVGVTGKVGFGITNQKVTIDGTTGASNPEDGTTSTAIGGLFANAGNIGSYKSDHFGILTDVNATFGYHFTSWLVGTVGYNFVHLSSVARPGNLFTGRVDSNLVPLSSSYGTGATTPAPFNYKQDDFFLHGLNFGFIVKY